MAKNKLRSTLPKYLTKEIIWLYAYEEKVADISGWMQKKGYSKLKKVTYGKFFHYEYILSECGRRFLQVEYHKRYDKLVSLIKNDNVENEYRLLNEIKVLMNKNYEQYVKERKTLTYQEKMALKRFEKLI